MIMQRVYCHFFSLLCSQSDSHKVPGRSAAFLWGSLSLLRENEIITQVARHLLAAFQLRFDRTGSLYLPPSNDSYFMGLIVGTFFQLDDGQPIFSDPQVGADLEKFRDPFTDVADWLSYSTRAENFMLNAKPRRTSDPPFDLDAALVNMNAGVELGSVYPGHHPVIPCHPAHEIVRQAMFFQVRR
jgi:hypothetical protein